MWMEHGWATVNVLFSLEEKTNAVEAVSSLKQARLNAHAFWAQPMLNAPSCLHYVAPTHKLIKHHDLVYDG